MSDDVDTRFIDRVHSTKQLISDDIKDKNKSSILKEVLSSYKVRLIPFGYLQEWIKPFQIDYMIETLIILNMRPVF